MQVFQTPVFSRWLADLRDRRARLKVFQRLDRVGNGLLGDVRSVGGGVSEMRIDYGPGYRLYYTLSGDKLVVLLVGGDKSSQSRDIVAARRLALEWSLES